MDYYFACTKDSRSNVNNEQGIYIYIYIYIYSVSHNDVNRAVLIFSDRFNGRLFEDR